MQNSRFAPRLCLNLFGTENVENKLRLQHQSLDTSPSCNSDHAKQLGKLRQGGELEPYNARRSPTRPQHDASRTAAVRSHCCVDGVDKAAPRVVLVAKLGPQTGLILTLVYTTALLLYRTKMSGNGSAKEKPAAAKGVKPSSPH